MIHAKFSQNFPCNRLDLTESSHVRKRVERKANKSGDRQYGNIGTKANCKKPRIEAICLTSRLSSFLH